MLMDYWERIRTTFKNLTLNASFIAFVIPPAPYTPNETAILKDHFLANITEQGAVMASPSKSHPDYYYHWVRDAAIAMSLVQDWYAKDHKEDDKTRLKHYVSFVNTAQHAIPTQGYELLGEPKFYLNGTVYTNAWGRPQNDGPALRAMTLIRFANSLLNQSNEKDYVTTTLYAPSLDYDAMGVIKRDLEYVASHWRDKSVDLWEESLGYHFFTASVQRQALLLGAKLAHRLNDPEAAAYYDNEASEMKSLLTLFIDHDTHRIKNSLLQNGPDKTDNIDTSIILGILKAPADIDLSDKRISNTIDALKRYFQDTYPINLAEKTVLMGRYPNDTYDGYETNKQGNPWPLLTATLADFYYQLSHQHAVAGDITDAMHYLEAGDNLLKRLKHYTLNQHLSEQFNRDSGAAQGANDLTWSYQAVLHALEKRHDLIKDLQDMIHGEYDTP